MNTGEFLGIRLSDFATDAISDCFKSVSLSIPFERLIELLTRAEQIQQAREPTDGRERIKSTRPTKKRRLSSSSVDELESEDEGKFAGLEAAAVQRVDTADKDFDVRKAKRRA